MNDKLYYNSSVIMDYKNYTFFNVLKILVFNLVSLNFKEHIIVANRSNLLNLILRILRYKKIGGKSRSII